MLNNQRGTDILGDIMESSILSPNRLFYGDLHNLGHVFLAFIHDPDHRNLESYGVMGEPTTAARDPIFYRWHAFVDDIFQTHKELLPSYTVAELNFPGLQVSNIAVQSEMGAANTFQTHWQQSDINFSSGLDFLPRGNVFARYIPTFLYDLAIIFLLFINFKLGFVIVLPIYKIHHLHTLLQLAIQAVDKLWEQLVYLCRQSSMNVALKCNLEIKES